MSTIPLDQILAQDAPIGAVSDLVSQGAHRAIAGGHVAPSLAPPTLAQREIGFCQGFIDAATRLTLRTGSWALLQRAVDLRIEGMQHLPRSGPAILASRHYHHLYDGCALLAMAPRPLHLLVGLDWVDNSAERWRMERICRLARWPVVLRQERLVAMSGAYETQEARRYLRRAAREVSSLLQQGRMVAIFPEGYPTVDPDYTPKSTGDEFLPFRDGFIRFAELAERESKMRVPILPVGLCYRRGERWQLEMRIGEPHYVSGRLGRESLLQIIEGEVRQLSR